MVEFYETDEDELDVEVARRLDLISNNPAQMMRYDSNSDGRLDREEWEVVRSLVRRQVLAEMRTTRPPPRPTRTTPAESPVASQQGKDWTRPGDDEPESLPNLERLTVQYELLDQLGVGSQGATYLARERATHRFVAIKELALSKMDNWKSLELFGRERDILKKLDHPSIPKCLDALEIEDGGALRFFIVQEFVQGETLEAELEHMGNFSPGQIIDLATQVLNILAYLQELDPPVIHRDVKPANLIRRANGQISLVDFGGSTVGLSQEVGGSTIVGTSGYMPPEQLMGRASKATDLFGLGATLMHLATGHHPSQIPQQRSKYDWRRYASLGSDFGDFVDRLLEPIAEDRFPDAARALAAVEALGLDDSVVDGPSSDELNEVAEYLSDVEPSSSVWNRPENSFVALERGVEHLSIRIPPRLRLRKALIGVGALVPAMGLVAFGIVESSSFFAFLCLCLGLWNLFFAFSSYSLDATASSWRVRERYWGINFDSQGEAESFKGGRVDRRERRGRYGSTIEYVLQVQADNRWHDVDVRLSDEEKRWIADEMNVFAADLRKVRIAQKSRLLGR